MKDFHDEGITLVALVVTIIAILVLAGITLNLALGDQGLLGRAQTASNTMAEATRNEMAMMDEYVETIYDETTNEYITEGLILHLDGINNTRNGHSTTTTTWEDLSGNNNDFTKLSSASNAIWSDNSFVGDETNRTLVLNKAILENATEATVEVCYDVPNLKDHYWVFQNRQVDQPPNGFQFWINSKSRRIRLWKNNSIYNSLTNAKGSNTTYLEKMTMAFAVDSNKVTFSENANFYYEDTIEGVIPSIMERNYYSISNRYPWQSPGLCLKGNIYSIRVYNRKLSEEELTKNFYVDKERFNMN